MIRTLNLLHSKVLCHSQKTINSNSTFFMAEKIKQEILALLFSGAILVLFFMHQLCANNNKDC